MTGYGSGQLSVKLQTLADCVQFVHRTEHLYVLQDWLDLFISILITYLSCNVFDFQTRDMSILCFSSLLIAVIFSDTSMTFSAKFQLRSQPEIFGGWTRDIGFKGKPWERKIRCHEFSVKSVSLRINPDEFYCEASVKLVTGKYAEGNLYGPASSLSDKSLIYPCKHFKCRLRCPCNPCRVNSSVCKNLDHEISPGGGCSECQDDYWEHLVFHIVEHTSCKFCREVASFLPHKKCVVFKTRGYYPNFHQVAIESFLVVHIPAYLKPDKTDSTTGFQCDKCEKSFPSEGNLRRHENEKHFQEKHTCTLCGRQFLRNYRLDMHMNALHRPSDTTQDQLKCERCGLQFQDKFSYERHTRSLQSCDVCAEEFCILKNLCDHKRLVHKAYTCLVCSKSFRDRENLKKHQNVMNCEFCDKQFCNGQEIRKHMKEHKESHKCSYCDKVMSSKKRLDVHLERRTDKSCSHCGKTFCYSADLNYHLKAICSE